MAAERLQLPPVLSLLGGAGKPKLSSGSLRLDLTLRCLTHILTPMLPTKPPPLPRLQPIPRSKALMPYGDADGAVILHAGRYARECVLVAFEMIGGVERMASWAAANPTEFYTRLYAKVITREVEVSASEGVEDLLLRLDRAERDGSQPEYLEADIVED